MIEVASDECYTNRHVLVSTLHSLRSGPTGRTMLASSLIISFSLILFVYWFRYTCLLVLRNAPEATRSTGIPGDAKLSFSEVKTRLNSSSAGMALDPLQRSLQHDYEVLTYLLNHAVGLDSASLDRHLLMLDYRIMNGWYRLTKTAAPAQARKALWEMAEILGFLAQRMGEQVSTRTEV